MESVETKIRPSEMSFLYVIPGLRWYRTESGIAIDYGGITLKMDIPGDIDLNISKKMKIIIEVPISP